MKTRTKLLIATLAATTTLGLSVGAQAQEAFAPTTTDRLLNADAEPNNWLMAGGNYSSWRYSQLDQINRDTVADLHVVYMFAIGGCSVPAPGGNDCDEQAHPLVENGILYLSDTLSRVMAFDVTSGNRALPLWRFDPELERTRTDRGIALYEDTVIQDALDGRIFALTKRSGEIVWDVNTQEPVGPNTAEAIATIQLTGAPLVLRTAGGRDIFTISPTNPAPGVGWFAAFDAKNGELVWRTYTIPLPGDPNFGTWRDETWRNGSAMPWALPSFDPETNLVYVGTGDPKPAYDAEYRSGDNLYSVSTLAFDADTGELKWYFQETPNEQWDYDSSQHRILYNITDEAGATRKVVSNWGRNGFFYQLDRVNGEFLKAIPTVDNINWTAGIDPKTGKPIEYNPSAQLQDYAVIGPRRGRAAADAPLVCATWGGAPTGVWPPSYDPTTGITYNTRTNGCTYQTMIGNDPLVPAQTQQVQVDTVFALIAIDTRSGEVVNTYLRDQGIPSDRQAEVGALATAGGLVFTGAADGRISAHNSDTLEELWSFNTGTDLKGGIMSFGVNGNQYIAKIIGGAGGGTSGIDALTQPTAMLVVWGL